MAKKPNYASLYTLRSDGRYQGYYRDENGNRHVICNRDPQTLYFKIEEKMKPKEEKPLMFDDLLELWDRTVWEKLSAGTQANYGKARKRAEEWFSGREVLSIFSYDITTFLESLKECGLSASTIRTQRVVIKDIFYRGIIHPTYGKILRINPAASVKLPCGLPKPKEREAPEDEIVQEIQDKCQSVYFGDFAMFLICTGMRRGEALSIRWCDVDFEKGFISVTSSVSLRGSRGVITAPKTESGIRPVPILPPVLKVLCRPAKAKDTDYIFHGDDPSLPMANSCYQRRWNHYCREMGFVIDEPEERVSKQGKTYIVHSYKNSLTAHCLRHGYATILYEAGIDEKEAANLMGHADEEMIRKVYAHLRNKKKAKASEILKQKTRDGLVII